MNIGNDWDKILDGEFEKEYYKNLRKFLIQEYKTLIIFPSMYDIFNALNRQSEAILSIRYPDKGGDMSYDINMSPSEYVSSDIEMLQRLENIILR